MSLLGFAVALIAVLTAANLLLSLGLVRRVLRLERRGLLQPPSLPRRGLVIGSFSVVTRDGQRLTDEILTGQRMLVAFLETGCPPCAAVVDELIGLRPAERTLAIVQVTNDGDAEDVAEKLATVSQVAIVTPATNIRQAFGVSAYPTVVRAIDGRIDGSSRRFGELVASRR